MSDDKKPKKGKEHDPNEREYVRPPRSAWTPTQSVHERHARERDERIKLADYHHKMGDHETESKLRGDTNLPVEKPSMKSLKKAK